MPLLFNRALFMEFKYVKIVVFVPGSHAEIVRKAFAESGAGHIGNYDSCSFSGKGTGRFRGLEGTDPFIGESGNPEVVEEEKIEVICPFENKDMVVRAALKAHPYEEPAIDIYPLLNE